MHASDDLLPEPTDADLQRLRAIQSRIGGEHVHWNAQSLLDALVVEHRMRAERKATARLARATWALVGATGVLVLATVGLIVATITS
ncbi:MAG TPA: hypothetical protein VFH70_08955 [Acidimicrobiales bacterium]|nr:hypothetical protein [Acidimicrobiales bacterium]